MPKSAADIALLKGTKKIVAITAYDSTMASLLDRSGVDVLLVGDSAAMVMMGHDSTQRIGMDEMCLFTASVATVKPHALVVADMPFMSYQPSIKVGVSNAKRLVNAGAQAVKLEGGLKMARHVAQIVASGIPVMGHIGFLPQTDSTKRRGMNDAALGSLVDDAQALESAGAFAIVLEMVSSEAAAQITRSVKIPTIGIGSGVLCDGQVLVAQDMLGMYERIKPSFVKRYRNLAKEITAAVLEYKNDVESGAFPADEHWFSMGDGKN